jgi:hypothetical protein
VVLGAMVGVVAGLIVLILQWLWASGTNLRFSIRFRDQVVRQGVSPIVRGLINNPEQRQPTPSCEGFYLRSISVLILFSFRTSVIHSLHGYEANRTRAAR